MSIQHNNYFVDEDKFGQKMLEKMGWSKGRGLGANEDGRSEHVSVEVKTDSRGIFLTIKMIKYKYTFGRINYKIYLLRY